MQFEWDSLKNEANQLKHNISFEEATTIFEGDYLTKVDNRKEYGEIRKQTLGVIKQVIVVMVVHTDRSETIRIISARPADQKERKAYNEHLQNPKKAA
jgi:uncharacterized protein